MAHFSGQNYVTRVIQLPPDLNAITEARIVAEDEGDDARILLLRELELAHLSLPPTIDGIRRSRLLATDAITTTWEGWDVNNGTRMFMRCLRPQWKSDPVMLRRVGRGANASCSWHADGDWPHLRVITNGAPLVDRFPIEDVPSTLLLARFLGHGLRELDLLHQKGHTHGGPLSIFLVEGRQGVRLIHMDAFEPAGSVADDIQQLAQTVHALDPLGCDPVGQLAREWVESPPPTAADGTQLLIRCLSGTLLAERHRLSVAGRTASRWDRSSRLARAVRKLSHALPPPTGKFCLKAGADGVIVIAESDGDIIRGGAAADASEGRFLPIIYSPTQGLDAQCARFLLRSWALRGSGDEKLRGTINAELNASDEGAHQLIRWMSGMARLRAARLLLSASQSAAL